MSRWTTRCRQGVNFFDTAELYSIPPKAETQGSTERIIGTWFKARRNRDKVILASKVVGRTAMTWFREDKSPGELNRAQMTEALERASSGCRPTTSTSTSFTGRTAPCRGARNPTVYRAEGLHRARSTPSSRSSMCSATS